MGGSLRAGTVMAVYVRAWSVSGCVRNAWMGAAFKVIDGELGGNGDVWGGADLRRSCESPELSCRPSWSWACRWCGCVATGCHRELYGSVDPEEWIES